MPHEQQGDRSRIDRGDGQDDRPELPRDPSEESRVPGGAGNDPAWDRSDRRGPEQDPNLDRGGPEGGVPRLDNDPSVGL